MLVSILAMPQIFLFLCPCMLSHVRLFATPWTVAHQAPLSIGFSRHGYRNGLPLPSPGDLPDPGIKTASSALAAGLFVTRATWEAPYLVSFAALHSRIH